MLLVSAKKFRLHESLGGSLPAGPIYSLSILLSVREQKWRYKFCIGNTPFFLPFTFIERMIGWLTKVSYNFINFERCWVFCRNTFHKFNVNDFIMGLVLELEGGSVGYLFFVNYSEISEFSNMWIWNWRYLAELSLFL